MLRLALTMLTVGALGPLWAMKDANLGEAKALYLFGLVTFGICAAYQIVKTLGAYDGQEANFKAWRMIGILSIAGAPSVIPLPGLFGDPADAPSWIYLGSSACGFLQFVVIAIGYMMTVGLPDAPSSDPGRTSDP